MGTNIIGLVGFIGSGKNSVADILIRNHSFEKESFAAPLKDACSVIFKWDRTLLEGDTEESRLFRETPDAFWSEKMGKNFTPRLAMQLMGTQVGRNIFYEDLWVDALIKRINFKSTTNSILRQETNIVISDVRFPNEIDKIREIGGRVYRVIRGPDPEWFWTAFGTNRNSIDNTSSMTVKYPDIHYSEWAWIGHEIDGVIKNNHGLVELEHEVNELINKGE